MYLSIYKGVAALLLPVVIIICLLFVFDNIKKANNIVDLQSQLISNKNQDIKVYIDTVQATNSVGVEYAEAVSKLEREKFEHVKTIEKITTNTVFSTVCVSDDGVQYYNSKYTTPSTTDTSEPVNPLP